MPAPSWPRIAGNSPSGSAPEQRELVGVADAGRLDLDQHLAGLRAFEVDRLDGERLAGLPRDGGPGFHARVLPMIRSGDYVKPRFIWSIEAVFVSLDFTDRAERHMSAGKLTKERLVPDVRAAIIPVTPFQQNCTLLWCEKTKKAAVVDPGGDLERIRDAIAQSGASVEKILLTHGHIDHAGGAAELRDELGVPVEGPHEADDFLLQRLAEQGQAYGFEARAVTPDRWLDEGDTVTVGDLTLDVLHCPGHSPGSVVLVSPSAALRPCRRRAVPGLGRAHRPSRRRRQGADRARSRTSSCRSATTSPSSAATAP